ncbi:MAG: TolC family protein [Candidatus Brocadiae bacterium]|nr:TolC family protein [Candidatus Brocadiia bacterium]
MKVFLFFLGSMMILAGCSSSVSFLADDFDGVDESKVFSNGNEIHAQVSDLSISKKIESLDINKAVEYTIQYNPELQKHKKLVRQIAADGKQADLYPNPTLEFLVEGFHLDSGKGFRDSEITIEVSQEILLGKGKFHSVQALSHEQKAALASFYALRREAIARVKKSFINVLYIQESLKVAQTLKENAFSLVEILEAKYKEGILKEVELLSAKTFLARREGDIVNLLQKLTLAKRQLAADIGNISLADENFVGDLQPVFYAQDLMHLKTIAMRNPLVVEAQYQIEQQKSLLAEAQAKQIPNITLFLGYRRNEASDENTAQIGFSIPLPIFNRNQGQIESKQLSMEASQENLKLIQNNLFSQIGDAHSSHQEVHKQIEILQNHTLPLAKRSLDLAKIEFEEGRQSFLLYLEANRAYHEAQSDYLDAVKKANDTQIELERLLGISSVKQ